MKFVTRDIHIASILCCIKSGQKLTEFYSNGSVATLKHHPSRSKVLSPYIEGS